MKEKDMKNERILNKNIKKKTKTKQQMFSYHFLYIEIPLTERFSAMETMETFSKETTNSVLSYIGI